MGAGSAGTVSEAAQPSLGRTVALRVIDAAHFATAEELARFDEQQRRMASLHHRNLVPCYGYGEWPGGRFVAMRLIRGERLADLFETGSLPSAESLAPLEDALRAAHDAGLVHGRISAENVLVEPDGTPYLADLGLGHPGSEEEDAEALAALISRVRAQSPSARPRRLVRRVLATAALAAVAVAAVTVVSGDEGSSRVGAVPTQPLGCLEEPSPNTPACTLVQTRLGGRDLAVPRPGVIRSWTVRGASGELALQVIRERRRRSFVVGFSQLERLSDPAPHTFPAAIGVRRGDRIAIGLGPGATIGSRPAPARSAIGRWDGGLTADPRPEDATTRGVELMLRAEFEFGARAGSPLQLTGDAAATAPGGRQLGETEVPLSRGREARAQVVELRTGITLDLVRGQRLARLEVPYADPAGQLLEIVQNCGPVGPQGFCLRWRNPGEQTVETHYYVVRDGDRLELIG